MTSMHSDHDKNAKHAPGKKPTEQGHRAPEKNRVGETGKRDQRSADQKKSSPKEAQR